MITLYGTKTSPYVRRVRVVAHELELATTLIDTSTPEGQARLGEVTPVWKIPVAEVAGRAIFDSRVITEHLLREHGPGPLRALDTKPETSNLVTVVDGALDALINAFYLAKDGVLADGSAYMAKQHARARSALTWLEARVAEGSWSTDAGLGLPEIALVTALDWMRFREMYPVDEHPGLAAVLETYGPRPSFASTRPGQ